MSAFRAMGDQQARRARGSSTWDVSCQDKTGAIMMIFLTQLFLTHTAVPEGNAGAEANYRVVNTDYTSYAILYNCRQKLFIKKGEMIAST